MPELVTEFTVRAAQEPDLDAMAALWHEAAEAFVSGEPRYKLAPDGRARWRSAMRTWLARDDMAVYVAECDGRAIGYIVGAVAENAPGLLPEKCGLVSDLAVDFHARTGRIGRELFEALKAWFSARGVGYIEARVPFRHPVAQAFWRALGAGKVYEQFWLKLE